MGSGEVALTKNGYRLFVSRLDGLGSSPKTVANGRRNLAKTAVFLYQNGTLSMCYKDLPEVRCGWCRFEWLREFTRKLFNELELAKLRAKNSPARD